MVEPRVFVCGWPIAHSRSPLIHGWWLDHYGLAGSYERFAVEPGSFDVFATVIRDRGFVGGNVTIPHKEHAFAAVARRDAAAEAIGAVNTLWFEGDVLCGGNTDAYGFAANLDAEAPGWSDAGTALVLGAGGAARAVIHALTGRGIDRILIVNRTEQRARDLAAMTTKASAHGWGALPTLISQADLVINTTSLGMAGKEASIIDLSTCPDHALVTDIVYVPLETPLLSAARDRGLRTVDGLGMLLHQAVPGFERWFGRRPEVRPELRALIVADMDAGL